MSHLASRQDSKRLRQLAVEWGGVPSLSRVLGIHRSTLYRYMGGKFEIPNSAMVTINYFAEQRKSPLPFQSLPPIDDDLRRFLDKHFTKHTRRTST